MARNLEPGRLPPHLNWVVTKTANEILTADDGLTREEKEQRSDAFCLGFLRFIQTRAGEQLDKQILRSFIYRAEFNLL